MQESESNRRHPTSVAVVMTVLNDAEGLPAAIESVQAQSVPVDEIAIAVGPSHDGSNRVAVELASKDPRIAVIDNPTGEISAGLNLAIQATSAAVLVRVDARSVLPSDYIGTAISTMSKTGAANVGGVQRAVGRTPMQKAIAAAMSSNVGVGGAKFHIEGGTGGETDTVYLGVFERQALSEAGGYDETLLRNEDYELNWRLREAGHKVWFDPNLAVDYLPRASLKALGSQYWQYGRWKREVLSRHPKSVRLRQLVAPAATVGLPVSTIAGLIWPVAFVVPAAYAAVVAFGAATAPGDLTVSGRARLLAVFPTMHFSWGSGFLAGSPVD